MVNLVDSNESVQNTYQYDAFGNKVTSTTGVTNVYEFTGEEFDDDTDLLYLRARYYDPEVGRFVSRDPLVEHLALNASPGQPLPFIYPYVYCDNNPVNWVDPEGYQTGVIELTLFGLLVAFGLATAAQIVVLQENRLGGGRPPGAIRWEDGLRGDPNDPLARLFGKKWWPNLPPWISIPFIVAGLIWALMEILNPVKGAEMPPDGTCGEEPGHIDEKTERLMREQTAKRGILVDYWKPWMLY